MKRGAPKGSGSKATPEIKAEIAERMSTGETETSIRKSLGLSAMTLWRWRNDDKEFELSIARARQAGYDALADECVQIADDGTDDPNSRRVRVDTRLRLLAKWCSGRYGDKLDTTLTLKLQGELGGNADV